MADRIYKPGVGPTSSRERADALDATVPNPDEVCIIGEVEHIFSSKLYPVDAIDVILVSATIGDDCRMTAIPFHELTVTFGEGPGGTLEQVRWFYYDGPYGPDELTATFGGGPDGSLVQLRWFYYDGPYGPDELTATFGPGLVFTLEEITIIVEASSGHAPNEPWEPLQLSLTINSNCTMDAV